jgi:hypothetical protein
MPHLLEPEEPEGRAGAHSPAITADRPAEVEVQRMLRSDVVHAQHSPASQDSSNDLSLSAIPIDFSAPSSVAALQIQVESIDLMPATREELQREHERHYITQESLDEGGGQDEVEEGLASTTRPHELWLDMDLEGYNCDEVASHGGIGWPGGVNFLWPVVNFPFFFVFV